jgi:hypothetical protein
MKVRNFAPALAAALALSLTLGGPSAVFAADKPAAKASAVKADAKTDAKKADDKKAPCRDAKGKFVKCPAEKPAKKAPCRDAKGRFTKCPK